VCLRANLTVLIAGFLLTPVNLYCALWHCVFLEITTDNYGCVLLLIVIVCSALSSVLGFKADCL
jgi:hypothetical protein